MMDGWQGYDLDAALRGCGVTATTLARGEAEALDRDGYVVLQCQFVARDSAPPLAGETGRQ